MDIIKRLKRVFKIDGFNNRVTNTGPNLGWRKFTVFTPASILSTETLNNLYLGNGICQRIIKLIIDESFAKDIICETSLLAELERLDFDRKISIAAASARLHGSSLMVLFINDGRTLDKPLNRNTIKEIRAIKIFNKNCVRIDSHDLNDDYTDINYQKPEYFTINSGQGPIKVHHTRCFVFDSTNVSDMEDNQRLGSGESIVYTFYQSLLNYSTMQEVLAEVMKDYSQRVFYVEDLALKMATDPDGTLGRFGLIQNGMSISNGLLLQKDAESFTKVTTPTSGLGDILRVAADDLSAQTGIPYTKLFTNPANGLNATGNLDMEYWYKMVETYRNKHLKPAIDWIIDILKLQNKWQNKPESYEWSFPPLKQMTEEEKANVDLINARTDEIWINTGAIDARYLFEIRQEGIEYNKEHYLNWLKENDTIDPIDEEDDLDNEEDDEVNVINLSDVVKNK